MESGPFHRALQEIPKLRPEDIIRCTVTKAGELACQKARIIPPRLRHPRRLGSVRIRDEALFSYKFVNKLRQHGTRVPQLEKAAVAYEEEWSAAVAAQYPSYPDQQRLQDDFVKALGNRRERFACRRVEGQGVGCKFEVPGKWSLRWVSLTPRDGTAYMTKGFLQALVEGLGEKEEGSLEGGEQAAKDGGADGDGVNQLKNVCVNGKGVRDGVCQDSKPTVQPVEAQAQHPSSYPAVTASTKTTVTFHLIPSTTTVTTTVIGTTPAIQPSQTPNIDEILSQISSIVHAPSFSGHSAATGLVDVLSAAVLPTPASEAARITSNRNAFFPTCSTSDIVGVVVFTIYGLFGALGFGLLMYITINMGLKSLAAAMAFPDMGSVEIKNMPTIDPTAADRGVVRKCFVNRDTMRRAGQSLKKAKRRGVRIGKVAGLGRRRISRNSLASRNQRSVLSVVSTKLLRRSSVDHQASEQEKVNPFAGVEAWAKEIVAESMSRWPIDEWYANAMKRSASQSSLGSDMSLVDAVSDAGSEEFELLHAENFAMPRHNHGS